jgi:hypothetical protein
VLLEVEQATLSMREGFLVLATELGTSEAGRLLRQAGRVMDVGADNAAAASWEIVEKVTKKAGKKTAKKATKKAPSTKKAPKKVAKSAKAAKKAKK